MANDGLSEVNNRAGDTVLYNSGNECLAIKPDASLGSLQDALGERLDQVQAVIQMLAFDTADAEEIPHPTPSLPMPHGLRTCSSSRPSNSWLSSIARTRTAHRDTLTVKAWLPQAVAARLHR